MKHLSLINHFYQALAQKYPQKLRDQYSIKPSSLGTKCFRKLYYSSFRVPEDFGVPLNVSKMGAMGDGIASILSDKFRARNILIDYKKPDGSFQTMGNVPNLEFPITSKELHIKKGFIDAVFNLENSLWLGEYKSCTAKSFAKLSKPKPDHLIQGVLYLFVFNKLLQEGAYKHIKELDNFKAAEGITFIYVNRDNAVEFEMKEFIISLQSAVESFKEIVQKVYKFKHFADNKMLPPKTPEWCQSCNWRVKCAQDYNF